MLQRALKLLLVGAILLVAAAPASTAHDAGGGASPRCPGERRSPAFLAHAVERWRYRASLREPGRLATAGPAGRPAPVTSDCRV